MNLDYFSQEWMLTWFRAVLDTLVVSYIIYRILLLIRGTRAQQVLTGLLLISVTFFVARHLELKTLSWLMDTFISSFLLIVIVVFQHDIRRGLSRVGRRSQSDLGYGRGAFLVDELTRATSMMGKEKLGAIIIIERDGDLNELAETGIRVDARITTALLAQIFTPPGPLHDGAVIIQGGRITAAAVFLPLSQNPRLDPLLGTRHRAAVGITEELDAIALVVSEERGQVSIAEGGSLTRDLDETMLRKVLLNYLGPAKQKRKP
jgi:diadenylate cyclase